jgi:hypothetical protein
MKFRLVFIYLFISVSQVACSQQKEIILKKCFSESTESFPSKNYTCQKLSFEGENLVYKINYSYNGWQIIDSIAYLNEGGKDCIKSFQPIYDVENRTVKSYELLNVDCNQKIVSFNNINDKYGLSKEYLGSIQSLLSKHPEKNNDEYKFKEGIIPSLFTQYGIPYNEPLSAFTFKIEGDVLQDDSFVYESFILTRNYEYENELLKQVKIVVKDRSERIISQFTETFELE